MNENGYKINLIPDKISLINGECCNNCLKPTILSLRKPVRNYNLWDKNGNFVNI